MRLLQWEIGLELILSIERFSLLKMFKTLQDMLQRMLTQDRVVAWPHVYGAVGRLRLTNNWKSRRINLK